ncbi:MAG: hypothetical protein KatS3mg105_1080 [Gemmatales bacterium]|nr:MAG: hypothetical protein KatS3mg105_1080 [Gemmatales bacterium]
MDDSDAADLVKAYIAFFYQQLPRIRLVVVFR